MEERERERERERGGTKEVLERAAFHCPRLVPRHLPRLVGALPAAAGGPRGPRRSNQIKKK